MIQWHPLFAQLLRPMLERYYEVQTGVSVGDAPRAADIVLLRRTSRQVPPFRGLWRWLTLWNVLEYKGPTVSARVPHLDALLELGLGIRRRLNEESHRQNHPATERSEVSFWYVANQLGRRFLHEAGDLLGNLEALGPGVWRALTFRHPIILVSRRAVPVEPESLPIHVLALEPDANQLAMARLVVENEELWARYGPYLTALRGPLYEEVMRMARAKKTAFPFFENIVKNVGRAEIARQVGVQGFIEEFGAEQIVKKIDADDLYASLSPEQRRRLQERLQAEKRRRP